jgi:hypothetical protein
MYKTAEWAGKSLFKSLNRITKRLELIQISLIRMLEGSCLNSITKQFSACLK